MTKKEWLERCEMVYDLGMVDDLRIAYSGMDYFMRMKPSAISGDAGAGHQADIGKSIMEYEIDRSKKTLANDTEAYKALEAMSILTKTCQKCATLPTAWHTRSCDFGCRVNEGIEVVDIIANKE